MPLYGYNFPWSGRFGRISDCCPYCGDDGLNYRMSSLDCCMECHTKKDKKQIPELQKSNEIKYEELAKKWCLNNNINYEKTVSNLLMYMGPRTQERDTPIPGNVEDYIIYLDPVGPKYVDEIAQEIKNRQRNTKKILNKKWTIIYPLRYLSYFKLDKLYARLILGWISDREYDGEKYTGKYYFWTGTKSYIIKEDDYKLKNPIIDYRTEDNGVF